MASAVVILVVALWIAGAVLQTIAAARSLDAGVVTLEGLQAAGSGDLLTSLTETSDAAAGHDAETLPATLATAGAQFADAAARLGSPVLAPVRVTPFLGRQLGASRELAEAARTVTNAAADAAATLADLDEDGARLPSDRVEVAQAVRDALEIMHTELSSVEIPTTDALIGPIESARQTFDEELATLTTAVDDALTAVSGVAVMLEGPTRYLVIAANNAEMRAGSAMFLQAGPMDIDDGTFTLGEFEPTEALYSEEPQARLDPDIAALWGDLEPSQEWRNLNLTPRFDEAARMAAEMWTAAGRGELDGVVAVDIIGLRNILEVIGPVEVDVDGTLRSIDAQNVAQELLLGQYQQFPDDASGRREVLGRVASAAFTALNEGELSMRDLLDVLRRSGDGRNLLLWSDEAEQRAAWDVLGLTGEVPENAVLPALLNRGGNKLDQFVEMEAELVISDTGNGRRLTVAITIRNEAPSGLPRYVEGPFPGSDFVAGEYFGLLALTIPTGAGDPSLEGGTIIRAGPDGTSRVVVAPVRLLRGESTEMVFDFELSEGWTELDVLPSTRVPAVSWTADGTSWRDDATRTVDLEGSS